MGIFDNGLVQQPNTMIPGWGAQQPWQQHPNLPNNSTVNAPAGGGMIQPGAVGGGMPGAPAGYQGGPQPMLQQNTNMPMVGLQAGQQNTNMGMVNTPPPPPPPSPLGPAPGQVGNGFNTGYIGPRPTPAQVAPQPHPAAGVMGGYHGTHWGTGPAPMPPQAPPGIYHPNLPQQPGVTASPPTGAPKPPPVMAPKPPPVMAPQPHPLAPQPHPMQPQPQPQPQPAQYGGLSQQDFQARNRALMSGRGPYDINGGGIGIGR